MIVSTGKSPAETAQNTTRFPSMKDNSRKDAKIAKLEALVKKHINIFSLRLCEKNYSVYERALPNFSRINNSLLLHKSVVFFLHNACWRRCYITIPLIRTGYHPGHQMNLHFAIVDLVTCAPLSFHLISTRPPHSGIAPPEPPAVSA